MISICSRLDMVREVLTDLNCREAVLLNLPVLAHSRNRARATMAGCLEQIEGVRDRLIEIVPVNSHDHRYWAISGKRRLEGVVDPERRVVLSLDVALCNLTGNLRAGILVLTESLLVNHDAYFQARNLIDDRHG
jgi:hypothetical protein